MAQIGLAPVRISTDPPDVPESRVDPIIAKDKYEVLGENQLQGIVEPGLVM